MPQCLFWVENGQNSNSYSVLKSVPIIESNCFHHPWWKTLQFLQSAQRSSGSYSAWCDLLFTVSLAWSHVKLCSNSIRKAKYYRSELKSPGPQLITISMDGWAASFPAPNAETPCQCEPCSPSQGNSLGKQVSWCKKGGSKPELRPPVAFRRASRVTPFAFPIKQLFKLKFTCLTSVQGLVFWAHPILSI